MNDDNLLSIIRMIYKNFQTFELLEDELEKTINMKNDLMRWDEMGDRPNEGEREWWFQS